MSERFYSWFIPQEKAFNKLAPYYIVPINYNEDANFEKMVTTYLEFNDKKEHGIEKAHKDVDVSLETKDILQKIKALRLRDLIDTGFMFSMVMDALPELYAKKSGGDTIITTTKQEVYSEYVGLNQRKELAKFNEEQSLQILKSIEFVIQEQGPKEEEEKLKNSSDPTILKISKALRELGKFIATQLHLREIFRLDQNSTLFQALGYESTTYFKKQDLAYILKILPVKIETKYSNNRSGQKLNQDVKLGFIHDTIKNCFLLEAIKDEIKTNGTSKILASKSIVKDSELFRFIADATNHDSAFRSSLRQNIDLTKSDKSDHAAINAANSITILVAANYSFNCQDLSHINIKGSNVRNGIFGQTDFTDADLSYANLANIKATGAKFVKSNLIAVKLGIPIDLCGHILTVKSVSFSGDGKYVASGSADKTVKIWDVTTGNCLTTLQGHTAEVISVSFSGDGKYVASGSADKTVKIWDVTTGNCLTTLQGHRGGVNSVSFSGDGKYVASGSSDKTVKIWDVATGNCLTTLQDYTSYVFSVSFSGDGKYVASGSYDETGKIWDVATGKCLTPLQSHTSYVNSVSFSGDGKYVASGSKDNTVKIWDVATGNCLTTLEGHTAEVNSVSFSGDGKYVASGSSDKAILIWTNKNDTWLIEKPISTHEFPLTTAGIIVDQTKISTQNEKVFEQRKAKIEKGKNFIDESTGEIEHNSTFALDFADKISVQSLY